ncbi:MAG TPA: hypothetical protein ENG74_01710, partial [Thermoplasmatales archaeon]|nr:hypothetical protein [Thermoplasmatales archaeon]
FGDEPELVKDCVEAIINTFGYIPAVYKAKEKKVTKVVICNKAIAKFLSKLCGKLAEGKYLPFELLSANRETLSWLVWSLILGDGAVERRRIRYTTKSVKLAFGLCLSLIRLGYKPRIFYHKTLKLYHIEISLPPDIREKLRGKTPSYNPLKPRDEDYILHSNKRYLNFKDGYLIALIREVKERDYEGLVYNLEVEDDNTYTANMIIVHNCNGIEALARGEIVIAPKGGSWEEYMPEWGLIDSKPCPYVLKDSPIHVGKGMQIDVEKAVDVACDVLDNLDEYKARVQEYRKVLEERFTWEKVAEKLAIILEEVCENVT